jgi:hypothetical protein
METRGVGGDERPAPEAEYKPCTFSYHSSHRQGE